MTALDDRTREHLDEIERQVKLARGDLQDVEVTPWDFELPSPWQLESMRKACDLSRKEVADAIDYHEQTVMQVETGHKAPGRELLRRLLILYRREWSNEQ